MSTIGKTAVGAGCGVLALPVVAALVAAALLSSLIPGTSGASAAPSAQALADIPSQMLALYHRGATECPGLSWTILAAIGKIETDHGRDPTMVSSAGAIGPMQFRPSTFATYANPAPPDGKSPPSPWDPTDAVYAAARLLCANGARDGRDLPRAVRAYNHDDQYVDQVLRTAKEYAQAESGPTSAAVTAVAFARGQLGTPYVWGGDGPADGGFDCSGLTQAAFRAAGISLPRTAQAQYDHGPHLPPGMPLAPGDLLFYGTTPQHITHVALYTGGGQTIDAPHPGAVVRHDPARIESPFFQGATRPGALGGGDR